MYLSIYFQCASVSFLSTELNEEQSYKKKKQKHSNGIFFTLFETSPYAIEHNTSTMSPASVLFFLLL